MSATVSPNVGSSAATPTLAELRASIPEAAKDLSLNLSSVLQPGGALTPAQRWGVAVASAVAARAPRLRDVLVAEARAELGPALPAVVDDAVGAAAIMGMNNVLYRFRHLVGKPSYAERPARLRMNRLVRPATNRLDFELMSLAVSAINGCGSCVQAHEQAVVGGGLSEEQVHDAIRIAATVHGAAVALGASGSAPAASEPAAA